MVWSTPLHKSTNNRFDEIIKYIITNTHPLSCAKVNPINPVMIPQPTAPNTLSSKYERNRILKLSE